MSDPREQSTATRLRPSLDHDREIVQLVVLVGGVLALVLPESFQVLYLMIALPTLWSMGSLQHTHPEELPS